MSDFIKHGMMGGVAFLKFNRPAKLNAITHDMWLAIKKLTDDFAKRDEVKALFISSTHQKVFSAGADLEEFGRKSSDAKWLKQNQAAIRGALDAVMNFPKPTVAAVSGICYGGGLALALACDLRFAEVSSKFSLPPAKLGLLYPLPEIARLVEAVGYGGAAELLFTGKVIEAPAARWIGLVNDVYAREEFEVELNKLAVSLAGLSSTSLAGLKDMLMRVRSGQKKDTKDTEKMFLKAYRGEDFKAAMKALREKNRDAAKARKSTS